MCVYIHKLPNEGCHKASAYASIWNSIKKLFNVLFEANSFAKKLAHNFMAPYMYIYLLVTDKTIKKISKSLNNWLKLSKSPRAAGFPILTSF